jgi:hypothetical protein
MKANLSGAIAKYPKKLGSPEVGVFLLSVSSYLMLIFCLFAEHLLHCEFWCFGRKSYGQSYYVTPQ